VTHSFIVFVKKESVGGDESASLKLIARSQRD